MMRAFGVEISPLFLAILSAVCGGEPTQKEEGKKEREKRYLIEREVFSISKTATTPHRHSGTGKGDETATLRLIAIFGFEFND